MNILPDLSKLRLVLSEMEEVIYLAGIHDGGPSAVRPHSLKCPALLWLLMSRLQGGKGTEQAPLQGLWLRPLEVGGSPVPA